MYLIIFFFFLFTFSSIFFVFILRNNFLFSFVFLLFFMYYRKRIQNEAFIGFVIFAKNRERKISGFIASLLFDAFLSHYSPWEVWFWIKKKTIWLYFLLSDLIRRNEGLVLQGFCTKRLGRRVIFLKWKLMPVDLVRVFFSSF